MNPFMKSALAFIVLVLAGETAVWAKNPKPTPRLSVQGTTLVLVQADGSVLRGIQLEGQVLQLQVGSQGEVRPIKLASIKSDPDDKDILQYQFEKQGDDGNWKTVCAPNIDNETWGIPVDTSVSEHGQERPVSMTCASGAVAKCIRYGYKPWSKGRHGESLVPYHQACIHMIRADYAGDGTPHTKAGTFVHFYDDAVHWNRDPDAKADPDYAFEAGWSPEGAVCMARVRWPEFGSVEDIRTTSQRLEATAPTACTETTARSQGALIFNESRLVPRLGP